MAGIYENPNKLGYGGLDYDLYDGFTLCVSCTSQSLFTA